MKVVIDTNIFWVSVTRRSKSNWLFQALLEGEFMLCISEEILKEYEELIALRLSPPTADAVIRLLENLPNVDLVAPWFFWNLIAADPEDNKFVDCAVAGGANYLLTHDRHFDVLKTVEFPPVTVLKLQDFKALL
jgi:putative PIN family toxin of toxin-antitoxin system